MTSLPPSPIPSASRASERGHALLLTLLILLITALVAFGVLSIGRHARVKEMTHFSAQAGAESGASWIARCLNTVAMNNNAMAELIAQAGIYQALPTAMDLYAKDLKSAQELLKQIDVTQLPRDWQPIDKTNEIALAYDQLIKTTDHELKVALTTQRFINKQLSEQEMTRITHVQPDPTSTTPGTLWQAVNALDEVNQAILENLEVQTQLAVLRGSILDTTARQTEASALLLPTHEPLVPWQRGTFNDFAPIILKNQVYQSGMNLYDYSYAPSVQQLQQMLMENQTGKPKGPRGKCPVSIMRASIPRLETKRVEPENNMVQPMEIPALKDDALLRTLGPLLYRLQNHRLANHLDRINNQYLAQLWPDEKNAVPQICDSKWVTDLDEIFQIMDKNPQSINEIAFVSLQLKSAFAPTDPKFRSEGSSALLDLTSEKSLNIDYIPWHKKYDPRRWEKVGMEQLNPRIWREVWTYETHSDRSINIKPLPPTPATKWPRQPVYRVDDYLLLGINVGKPLELQTPFNFPADQPKPAPILYVSDTQNKDATDNIQRTVVGQNHERNLPWAQPVPPTEIASPMLAPYDLLVGNLNNRSLWFQGWTGQVIDNPKPDLANAMPTTELEPLVSGKLYESVLTELQNKIEQDQKEETQVP